MYVNLFAYSFDKRMIFLFLEKYSSKLPARQCLETLSLLHAHTKVEKQVSSLPDKHCDSDFPCSRKPSWGRKAVAVLCGLVGLLCSGATFSGNPFLKVFSFHLFVVQIIESC